MVAKRAPKTSCLPRPNRLPWTKMPPIALLFDDHDAVGSGAQGNLSFTEMLIRTPAPFGSHQTLTSAKSPVVLSRSRTTSSVSACSVSPMVTPAIDRTVDSSVRWLSSTRTSVTSSPSARAERGESTRLTPIRATKEAIREAKQGEAMLKGYRCGRDSQTHKRSRGDRRYTYMCSWMLCLVVVPGCFVLGYATPCGPRPLPVRAPLSWAPQANAAPARAQSLLTFGGHGAPSARPPLPARSPHSDRPLSSLCHRASDANPDRGARGLHRGRGPGFAAETQDRVRGASSQQRSGRGGALAHAQTDGRPVAPADRRPLARPRGEPPLRRGADAEAARAAADGREPGDLQRSRPPGVLPAEQVAVRIGRRPRIDSRSPAQRDQQAQEPTLRDARRGGADRPDAEAPRAPRRARRALPGRRLHQQRRRVRLDRRAAARGSLRRARG